MGTLAAGATSSNLLANEKSFLTSRYWRRISRIGLAGSATVADHELIVSFGKREIARLRASTVNSDVMPTDDDMKSMSEPALCPPGTDIILEVTDAPATNPLNWVIEIQELPELGMNPSRPIFSRRY